jgi:hypothetical protein
VGAAKDALDTARRLKTLPATDAALRAGLLSPTQAATVTAAATADPSSEASLLDAAPQESVAELRHRAERVLAAARSAEDEQARDDAIRRNRSFRRSVGLDGAHELLARGTAEQISGFWAQLQPFIDAEFARARTEGRRESPDAYAFDALLAISRSGGSTKSPAKVLVRVDLPALRRGSTAPGEVCEIAGYGPIPVTTAHRLMNDAFLALVLTKGKDVLNVTHLGRQFTEHQKTALEWRDPECQVLGCAATVRLERDHREDWADTHVTRVPAADRLCHHHHSLKNLGWHLEPGNGKRRIHPPTTQTAPTRAMAMAGHDPP